MQYLLYSNIFDLDIKLHEELNNKKVTVTGVHCSPWKEDRDGGPLGPGCCVTGTPIYWAVPEGPRGGCRTQQPGEQRP